MHTEGGAILDGGLRELLELYIIEDLRATRSVCLSLKDGRKGGQKEKQRKTKDKRKEQQIKK